MKMLKNSFDITNVKAKTLIYLIGLIVFISCWHFLGVDNAIVGFIIVHGATLMFNKDLTANPLRNIIKFFIAYIFIGIFSFLAAENPFLGLFINLVVIFFIAYAFFYDLKTSIWSPFILTYLILLTNPVTSIYDFPKRLIALSMGSLILIISQLIINRHRDRNDLRVNLIGLVKEISIKIDILVNNENLPYDYVNVEKYIDKILNIINERRDNIFYLGKLDNIRLNFALYIEKLNYSLDEVYHDTNDELYIVFLLDLAIILNDMVKTLDSKDSYKTLINELDKFTTNYEKLLSYNYSAYEIIQDMSMLRFALVNFANENKNEKTDIINYFEISKLLIFKDIFTLNFNFKSLRFTYAFRLSLLVSSSYFIVSYFNINHGKWLVIALFAVLQPCIENSNKSIISRFKGTVSGILLFIIIYFSFPTIPEKIVVLALIYYIYLFVKKSDLKVSFITAMALGLFSMLGHTFYQAAFLRFTYITIGILIGYFATKYIFPFSTKDAIKNFSKSYYDLSKEMLTFGFDNEINKTLLKELNNKLLLGKLYEDKLLLNNSKNNIKYVKDYAYNQRILMNNIYFLFYSLYKKPISSNSLNKFKNEINKVYESCKVPSINYNEETLLKEIKSNIKNSFKDIHSYDGKLISINLYRIILRLEISRNLREKFCYKL